MGGRGSNSVKDGGQGVAKTGVCNSGGGQGAGVGHGGGADGGQGVAKTGQASIMRAATDGRV